MVLILDILTILFFVELLTRVSIRLYDDRNVTREEDRLVIKSGISFSSQKVGDSCFLGYL